MKAQNRQPDPQSITSRTRAYLVAHPTATNPEIAAALGLTVDQAKDGRKNARVPPPRESGDRVRLPTHMHRGEGYRDHECAGYVDCLAGAAGSLARTLRRALQKTMRVHPGDGAAWDRIPEATFRAWRWPEGWKPGGRRGR